MNFRRSPVWIWFVSKVHSFFLIHSRQAMQQGWRVKLVRGTLEGRLVELLPGNRARVEWDDELEDILPLRELAPAGQPAAGTPGKTQTQAPASAELLEALRNDPLAEGLYVAQSPMGEPLARWLVNLLPYPVRFSLYVPKAKNWALQAEATLAPLTGFRLEGGSTLPPPPGIELQWRVLVSWLPLPELSTELPTPQFLQFELKDKYLRKKPRVYPPLQAPLHWIALKGEAVQESAPAPVAVAPKPTEKGHSGSTIPAVPKTQERTAPKVAAEPEDNDLSRYALRNDPIQLRQLDLVDLHLEKVLQNPAQVPPEHALLVQLAALDRAVDKAIQTGQHQLTIIHGIGSFTLRDEVLKRLRTYRQIRSVAPDRSGQYGNGALVARFH
jgi:hypothetical protein